MSFSFTDNDSVQLASDLENSGPMLTKDVIKIEQKKKNLRCLDLHKNVVFSCIA